MWKTYLGKTPNAWKDDLPLVDAVLNKVFHTLVDGRPEVHG